MKIFKTFYELKTATASRLKYSELIHQTKTSYFSEKKPWDLTGIYIYIYIYIYI